MANGFDISNYLGADLGGLTLAQQSPYAQLTRESAVGGYTMPAQYRQFMTLQMT